MKFNIFDLLLPRETKFYDFFQEQIKLLVSCCSLFREFAGKIGSISDEEVKKYVIRIKDIEHKGDKIEANIIDQLNQTFITPFDREDIHFLAVNIDRAIDILNSAANKIDIYNIKKMPEKILNFCDIASEISELLLTIMTSFQKKENVIPLITKSHDLETKADYLFHICLAELFHGDHSPIEIIKNKEIYEHLESVVDSVDFCAKIIRRIVIKQG